MRILSVLSLGTIIVLLPAACITTTAAAAPGATVPWTSYEAEAMTINGGVIMGPPPRAVDKNATVTNTFAGEASGRQCVKLSATGHYVQFAAQAAANALVVRCSVPDTTDGAGADYTISLYINGSFVRKIPLTSKYSWLYGWYTFSNNPSDGRARDMYDDARTFGLTISAGDLVRLQIDAADTAVQYIIDLVDLEYVGPARTQPGGSRSVMSYGAVGNGIADDTAAIRSALTGGGTVWFPSGSYLVTGNINVPSGTTLQGAGMWYTTFVGSPTTYVNENGRVRFNGTGSNINFADFAILGKLRDRNDSYANDGFSEWFGTGSSMRRVWVEHTKTGAWITNSKGMLISDCRFRNTIADGINLCKSCDGCIVTNCTARNTGDDSFAIWPAVYEGGGGVIYASGNNLITHCTAQAPFFANTCGIYGGTANAVQQCLFLDVPDGAGILIAGTFPVGTNLYRGTTVARDCTIVRAGGFDPGWQWRGALTICPHVINIAGLQLSNLTISNSLSYGVQFVSPGAGVLSDATMSNVKVAGYAVGVPPYSPWPSYCDGVYGVLARNDAKGSINVSDLTVNGTGIIAVPTNGTDLADQASAFTFNFLTQPVSVTVQTAPPGCAFTVDSVSYTTAQTFSWVQGALHSIGTTSPQNSSADTRDVWSSWSDGGAMTHTIAPTVAGTYTANFTRQFYLTMNAATGGSVSPASSWQNSNTVLGISVTPLPGYTMEGWSGSGNGSYTGTNATATITMRGPITQTPIFSSLQVQSLAFVQQPSNVPLNTIFTPAVQVRALGTNGLPLAGAPIALTLGSGAGTLAGTLSRVTDAGGIAQFNDLSMNQPGPKTLVAAATSGPATPVTSATVTVIGPLLALAFTTQPGAAMAGLPFGRQPVIQTVDAAGTPSTIGLPASLPVVISLSNSVGVLSGTTSYDIGASAGNGTITCSNLAIDAIGNGNQLVASPAPPATLTNPITGAVLWLDASDPATLTTNSTKVQAWKNKGLGGTTGANLWFTQATAEMQPLCVNQMGGRPVLTFSKNGYGYGVGCTYLGNIGLNAYTNNGSQMTYVAVLRQRDNTFGWQAPVSFSTTGQIDGKGTAGVVVLADGSQAAPYPLGIQRNRTATPMQANVAVPALLTPFVLTFVDNAGAATLRIFEAGGAARNNSASIVNGISPYKYNITDVTIGGRLEPSPGTIDNGWEGDVAEVLVYNTALSAADSAAVETYLSNKWFAATASTAVGAAVSAPFNVIPEPVGGVALLLSVWYARRAAPRRRPA